MIKELIGYLLIVIVVAVIFGIGYWYGGKTAEPVYITQEKTVYDTLVVVRPAEPIAIENVKTRIVKLRDTVILTNPFIATVDTVIKTDTVFASFTFPENVMSVNLRRKPDSTFIQTITITREAVKPRAWYEIPLYILSGSAIGFGAGYIVGGR